MLYGRREKKGNTIVATLDMHSQPSGNPSVYNIRDYITDWQRNATLVGHVKAAIIPSPILTHAIMCWALKYSCSHNLG